MSQTDAALSQRAQGLKGASPGRVTPVKSVQRRNVTWLHVPALIFMIIMTQIPFLLALWFSLHSWNLLQPAEGFPFVGLSNYINEFVGDPRFWPVMGHTVELVFGSILIA